jgi:hypothetical protein
LFLSIFGFLVSGLTFVGGAIGAAIFTTGDASLRGSEKFLWAMYITFGIAYGIPSYFLFRYSQRIREFVRDASSDRPQETLTAQKAIGRTAPPRPTTCKRSWVTCQSFLRSMRALGWRTAGENG